MLFTDKHCPGLPLQRGSSRRRRVSGMSMKPPGLRAACGARAAPDAPPRPPVVEATGAATIARTWLTKKSRSRDRKWWGGRQLARAARGLGTGEYRRPVGGCVLVARANSSAEHGWLGPSARSCELSASPHHPHQFLSRDRCASKVGVTISFDPSRGRAAAAGFTFDMWREFVNFTLLLNVLFHICHLYTPKPRTLSTVSSSS